MPPPEQRELVRALTPAEWAVLQPWLEEAQRAQEQAQLATARAVLARRHANALVEALNGGTDPTVRLDVEKRELYRMAPPPEST